MAWYVNSWRKGDTRSSERSVIMSVALGREFSDFYSKT
jgi:hypothetical protein